MKNLVSSNSDWFGDYADLQIFKRWTGEEEQQKYLKETFLDLIKFREVELNGVSQNCCYIN
jgi:hypothetical protein